jgi:hypothetical protein
MKEREDSKLQFSRKRDESDDIPIIRPEDCPRQLIIYINKKRKADMLATREMLREELEPVKHYWQMTANNRIWLFVISTVMIITGVLLVIVS